MTIPQEVTPPDSSPESEASLPNDSPQEEPDKARGEAVKRMFPDVRRKPSDKLALWFSSAGPVGFSP